MFFENYVKNINFQTNTKNNYKIKGGVKIKTDNLGLFLRFCTSSIFQQVLSFCSPFHLIFRQFWHNYVNFPYLSHILSWLLLVHLASFFTDCPPCPWVHYLYNLDLIEWKVCIFQTYSNISACGLEMEYLFQLPFWYKRKPNFNENIYVRYLIHTDRIIKFITITHPQFELAMTNENIFRRSPCTVHLRSNTFSKKSEAHSIL